MSIYNKLIIGEFQKSPNFNAIVDLLTSALQTNTDLVNSFQTLFDLDTAVGQQLDYTGQWIGITRNITPAITNVFFSFDIDHLGFDEGYWQGKYSYGGVTTLTDDVYRRLLYAKVMVNQCDGTIPGAIQALKMVFPDNDVFIKDNQDMTMDIILSGSLTPMVIALLKRGSFNSRPTGVLVNDYHMASTRYQPLFAFDLNTPLLAGFDIGVWSEPLSLIA